MNQKFPFSSKPSVVVTIMDPLSTFSSKSNLVVNTVDPLLTLISKFTLENVTISKSSLIHIVNNVNPQCTFGSKPSLVVETVDLLSTFSSKSSLVVNTVNPLLTFSSKFSLNNVTTKVDPLLNIRSKSNLVTNPSCDSSSNLSSSIMTFNHTIFTLLAQFYDVQKCNSVQIVDSTYVVQKAKLLNYFATALKYHLY